MSDKDEANYQVPLKDDDLVWTGEGSVTIFSPPNPAKGFRIYNLGRGIVIVSRRNDKMIEEISLNPSESCCFGGKKFEKDDIT